MAMLVDGFWAGPVAIRRTPENLRCNQTASFKRAKYTMGAVSTAQSLDSVSPVSS